MSASLLPPERFEKDDPSSRSEEIRSRPVQPNGRGLKTAALGGVCLLLLCLIAGLVPRFRRGTELAAAAREQQQAALTVTVAKPRQGPATTDLFLPATTQAIQETTIYARTSGSVRRFLVGMGKSVKAGELLAELDTPLTDQQLREALQQASEAEQTVTQARSELSQTQAALEQSQAALKQARTNLELARVNLERSKTLVAQGVVSRQDTDDKQAIFDARQADLEAAQANIRARQAAIKAQQSAIDSKEAAFKARQANAQRMTELKSFGRVVAPYDGVITARNLEVGVLINENGAMQNGNGLFRIARLDIIRVFINVPQTYVTAMQPGLATEVEVKEMPQRTFKGNVVGTSHSIDPASRTLMVEVRIPNPTQQLLPGMYAQVKFTLPAPRQTLLIPVGALVITGEDTQVLVLRPDQTVHVQKVEVGRDFGREVEILGGLSETDTIITTPSDSLREGSRVHAAEAARK